MIDLSKYDVFQNLVKCVIDDGGIAKINTVDGDRYQVLLVLNPSEQEMLNHTLNGELPSLDTNVDPVKQLSRIIEHVDTYIKTYEQNHYTKQVREDVLLTITPHVKRNVIKFKCEC